MSDPFASALDAIFSGPGSEAADHVSRHGVITPGVRVIRSKGDRDIRFGDGPMIAADCRVDIRRNEIAEPIEGDRLFIGTEEIMLTGEPMLDVEGLTWTIGYEAVDVSR